MYTEKSQWYQVEIISDMGSLIIIYDKNTH